MQSIRFVMFRDLAVMCGRLIISRVFYMVDGTAPKKSPPFGGGRRHKANSPPLYGHTRYNGKNRKSTYSSYSCRGRRSTDKCQLLGVRCEVLDHLVLKDLANSIFNKRSAKRIANEIIDNMKQQTPKPEHLVAVKKQLKDCKRKIGNIVTAIAEGIASSSLKDQLHILESEKTRLEDEIKFLHASCNIKLPSIEDIIGTILSHSPLLTSDVAKQKRIVNEYIKQIVVYKDHVEIVKGINAVNLIGRGEARPLIYTNSYNLNGQGHSTQKL